MSDNDIQQFDELAVKVKAAYAAHKEIYSAKYPPPQLKAVQRDYVSLIIMIGLVILMLASIVVSGSRTIPEFGGGFIGVVAFVMLEGGIMGYAFFYARRNVNENKLKDARRLALGGLGLAVIIALGANLDESLRQHGIMLPDWMRTGVNVLVALSAPGLAFISADVLAIELMAGDVRRRQNEQEHLQRMEGWQDGCNRSFAVQQKQWGLKIEIEKPIQADNSLNSMNERVNERPELPRLVNSSTGYSKQMNARSLIEMFFERHPERLNGRLDELLIEIEQESGVRVGRTSIHNVRKDIQSSKNSGAQK